MKLRLTAVALVALGAVTATALAGTSLADPKKLVLQKADFAPGAGARIAGKGADQNARFRTYFVNYRYGSGATRYEIMSAASVMSRALAVASFRDARSQAQGEPRLAMPKLGDEQFAYFAREDNEGWLWVRKGGTVWTLSVNTARGNLRLIMRPQAAAELKRYGPKQMRRVGSG